jgi:hypothetical protein
MNINFTFEDALSLTERLTTPLPWLKHNLNIVRDGYMDCGTRIHVVSEQQYKTPVMIANAVVISEDYEFLGK